MIMGEHAVLMHGRAIAAAVDARMTVQLTPRQDDLFSIISSLGKLQSQIDNIKVSPPFDYVLTAIQHYADVLPSGFDLTIASDFRHDLGLGSSAAVINATLAVLQNWLTGKVEPPQVFLQTAKDLVLTLKGKGSGADLAASFYGGVVDLQTAPLAVGSLPILPHLTVVYCGYKTPTSTVIDMVDTYAKKNPKRYQTLFAEIHALIEQCCQALRRQDWQAVGRCFNQQQTLMEELGVSDPVIDDIIAQLQQQPEILGSKISGSGLGDCVIGLGRVSEHWIQSISQGDSKREVLPIELTEQGLVHDKS